MAELGAAASVVGLVSLGVQLAECAVKLKKLCDQVEKAPEALRTLEIEVKLFSLLLQDVDAFRIQRGFNHSAPLLQCVYHCQIVTAKIVSYVREIEGMSRKYKLAGRVYAALRLSDVNSLCRDMERAKTNLIIALQLLTAGLPAMPVSVSQVTAVGQPQIAGSSAGTTTQAVSIGYLDPPEKPLDFLNDGPAEEHDEAKDVDSELSIEYGQASRTKKAQIRKFARSRQIFSLRMGLPWLFGQVVWDVSVRRSYQGWKICLQCENIVAFDSPIFNYALTGDALAVQKLFAKGEASPYDCRMYNKYGDTELLALVRPLVSDFSRPSTTEDADHTGHQGWRGLDTLSAEMYATILSHMQVPDQTSTAQKVLELHLHSSHPRYPDTDEVDMFSNLLTVHDVDVLDLSDGCAEYFASTNPFLLQQNLIDFGHAWTGTDWFNFYCHRRISICDKRPFDFINLCSMGNGVEALVPLRSSEGGSVLHFVAQILGQLAVTRQDNSEWCWLFTSLVDLTAGSALFDLVQVRNEEDSLLDLFLGVTPLSQPTPLNPLSPFMRFLRASCSTRLNGSSLRYALGSWRKLISSTSTSVDQFLEREMAIWKTWDYSMPFLSAFDPEVRLHGIYKDAVTGEWRGQYAASILLYRQPTAAPGAWPVSPYVPRTICWSPQENILDPTKDFWDEGKTVCTLHVRDSWLVDAPAELGGYGRVWKWRPSRTQNTFPEDSTIYDDDQAHDTLQAPKTGLRRSRSEPRSLPQAYNKRSRIFAGGLRYCGQHTRWNLQNNVDYQYPPSYQSCGDERCCNQKRRYHFYSPNARDLVATFEIVRRIRNFIKMHGIWPIECGYEDIVLTGEHPFVMDPYEVLACATLGFIGGSPPLCKEFPHCKHQEVYLKSLERRNEDDDPV